MLAIGSGMVSNGPDAKWAAYWTGEADAAQPGPADEMAADPAMVM